MSISDRAVEKLAEAIERLAAALEIYNAAHPLYPIFGSPTQPPRQFMDNAAARPGTVCMNVACPHRIEFTS